MNKLPFWKRSQLELGVNWQLFPNGSLSWRQWAFEPYAAVIWPGKRVEYKDMLDGTRGPGWMRSEEAGRDPVTNLKITHWYARYWRVGLALRVLGCDFGFGALYRPRNEVDAALSDHLATEGK